MVKVTTFFAMSLGAFAFWQTMDKIHVWIALHQDEKVILKPQSCFPLPLRMKNEPQNPRSILFLFEGMTTIILDGLIFLQILDFFDLDRNQFLEPVELQFNRSLFCCYVFREVRICLTFRFMVLSGKEFMILLYSIYRRQNSLKHMVFSDYQKK